MIFGFVIESKYNVYCDFFFMKKKIIKKKLIVIEFEII